MARSDQFTVGVDFGTLSGRAVVVRVSDGAEVGSAVHDYAHGGPGHRLPGGDGAAAARTGRSRCRATTSTCSRTPYRRRCARAGIDPGQVIGIGDRLHRLHRAAGARRRHAAVRAAGVRRPAARLRQALEAPRRPAAGGPDQRARARAGRALDRPLRRPDLQRVGVRQGPPAAGGGPRALRPRGPLRRGGGLDRLAADRSLRPQRVHRRLQGHLPGRPLPRPRLPGGAEPGVRRLRRRQARRRDRPARRRGGPAHRARPRRAPGCPSASPSRSATSTPTSPRPPRGRPSPARWSPSWAPRPAT